jgi:hypothetical protein
MAKHTIPLRITIEVDDEPAGPQIAVREVDGGAVLDVPGEIKAQLIQFGWLPPVEGGE